MVYFYRPILLDGSLLMEASISTIRGNSISKLEHQFETVLTALKHLLAACIQKISPLTS